MRGAVVTGQGLITIDQMIQREVLCCMSSLVSTLAQGSAYLVHHDSHRPDYCGSDQGIEAVNLMYQASELAAPVLDYEEAAIQAGWRKEANSWRRNIDPNAIIPIISRLTAQEACERDEINPYEWEVYEFWAVSTWLAEKLQAQGERVDTDFASLNIWARTATGQAIGMDGCIQRIYADMTKSETVGASA